MDLLNLGDRVRVIQEIKGYENRSRKSESFKQSEIFRDRQHKYVLDYLMSQFSKKTVSEMPVISSINLSRRIVKQEASIYNSAPEREFSDVSDEQIEVIHNIYQDMMADPNLRKANEFYKLQQQTTIQIIPKEGRLIMRPLLSHQVDTVPDPENPELALAYIISAYDKTFDKSEYTRGAKTGFGGRTGFSNTGSRPDFVNQKIGDYDDSMSLMERYVVWTKELNFIMDGRGTILSEDTESPIPGVLPFIDVAADKDFEYWVRQGQAITDFSIQLNGALSDLANIVRMQGWGQAYMIGEEDLIPENIVVGVNKILKLKQRPDNGVKPEFGFANASPDLQGSIEWLNSLLAIFLTSRGIDPTLISAGTEGKSFSSGVERFLALVEKFEASQEDLSLFKSVEKKLYKIVKTWHNALSGSGQLLPEYETSDISDDSQVSVMFNKPQMIQSDQESLASLEKRVELGLISRAEAIMEDRDVDKEMALEIIKEIDSEELNVVAGGMDAGLGEEEPGQPE